MSELIRLPIFDEKNKAMMFSKACEYGIRAAIYIATQSMHDERVSLKNIAEEIDSPVAFTAKILQQLARSGIVDSIKGPSGGFEIERNKIDKIKLSHIVSAIDGDAVYKGCGLGLKACDEDHPCPVHEKFKSVRDGLKEMLETTSIYEMATSLKVGLTYLKR